MTPSQARYLRNLLAYRDRPPTVGRIFRASLRAHLLLVVVFAAMAAISAPLYGWTAVALLGTSLGSVLLRDLGHFRSAVRRWPVTREVVDWPKVEHLAAANAVPPPPPP